MSLWNGESHIIESSVIKQQGQIRTNLACHPHLYFHTGRWNHITANMCMLKFPLYSVHLLINHIIACQQNMYSSRTDFTCKRTCSNMFYWNNKTWPFPVPCLKAPNIVIFQHTAIITNPFSLTLWICATLWQSAEHYSFALYFLWHISFSNLHVWTTDGNSLYFPISKCLHSHFPGKLILQQKKKKLNWKGWEGLQECTVSKSII